MVDIVLGYRKRKPARTANPEELNPAAEIENLAHVEPADKELTSTTSEETVEPLQEALTPAPLAAVETTRDLPADEETAPITTRLDVAKIEAVKKAAEKIAALPALPKLPKLPFDMPDKNKENPSMVDDDLLLLLLIVILLRSRK